MALNDARLRLVAQVTDGDVIVELSPDDMTGDDDASRGTGTADVRRPVVRRLPATQEDRDAGVARFEVSIDGWNIPVTAGSAERAALRERATRMSGAAGHAGPQTLRARIPGRVAQVWVAAGAAVQSGERLLSIEAMKMENEIRAPHAGTVVSVAVAVGDRVELGSDLVVVG